MSLFKQLFIAICLLMLVTFTGSFMVGLETSRAQQESQLQAHAQDAATALGLSLGPYVKDPAMLQLMVSSIYDSGYYQQIRIVDSETQKVILQRTGAPVEPQAPEWFAALVALKPAQGEAIISDGWRDAARVEVVSHPLFAIDKLWSSATGSLVWLALCALLGTVLGAVLLKRQLRPLDYLVEQSNAIARREFLSAARLPRAPELRRVVAAMNQMVEKLKALFAEEAERGEQLRAQAYDDRLTGLGNRSYLDAQLLRRLETQDSCGEGYLVLLRMPDLVGLNQRLGGEQTDRLLRGVAHWLIERGRPGDVLARSRAGEFAWLIEGMSADEIAPVVSALLHQANTWLASHNAGQASVGWTHFAAGMSLSDVYRSADASLQQSTGSVMGKNADAWRRLLEQSLAAGKVSIVQQKVVSAADHRQVLHYKVLARMLDDQEQTIAAGTFLPWLERFGWTERLDFLVLQQVFARLMHQPKPLAVTLHVQSLLQDSSVRELLKKHKALASHLTLELDEAQLPSADELASINQFVRQLGYGLAVQHFGGCFSRIGNLAKLGLSYLKVDGFYIRNIDLEQDKQLFIQSLQRAASSIDVPLIAEQVQTAGEAHVLQTMGLYGEQGQLIGEVEALD